METNNEVEKINASQIIKITEPQEADMNMNKKDRGLWINRYNMKMSVRNFLDKDWIDFSFYRTELSPDFERELIEAAGFNGNHHDYQSLSSQVRYTFDLDEIAQFMGCLRDLDIAKFNITPAVLNAANLEIPQERMLTVTVGIPTEEYPFSELDGYTLPFEIIGRYNKVS